MNRSDDAGDVAAGDESLPSGLAAVTAYLGRLTERFTLRSGAQVVWAIAVLWWLISGSRMTVPNMILVGFVSAILFVRDARPMTFVRIFRDWLAIFIWLIGWAISRSAVDSIGMPVQEQIWIDIDRVLGFGELPNHRLQQLIDWDAPARLWEATLSIMYISHFFVGFGVLIGLYLYDRKLWGRWWRRYILVGSIGLVCFILVPSAPPWMASDNGTVAMVYEGIPRGWDAIEVEWIHRLFEFGRDKANPIAAMPSLHAAFPALLYFFFAPRSGRLMRFTLAAYALYMGFVIVITGQHWLIDVFAGWLVGWAAHDWMNRGEAWNARRKAARSVEAPAGDEPADAHPTAVRS